MKRLIIGLMTTLIILGCGRLATPIAQLTPAPQTTPSPRTAEPTPTPRPTVTPRPATPIATPTPTITPTPIIYTVQAGDTLLKIAIQFDRSTDIIQEVNGIVDPRLLQIGQQLIIPPPDVEPDEPPTPTPTPFPLDVTAINFQETGQGALWLLGEVSNPGRQPVTEVALEASLFDGAGVLLAREAAFAQLDVVPPNQAVPFAILFETPPGDFAQYQVAAVSGVPLSDQTRYYFDLAAVDLQGSPEGTSIYRLRGQLHNRGQLDAEAIRLVAAAYDEEGKVLAQRQAQLDVSLIKAGARTPFEIDLTITHGLVDHYNVLVQALEAR